MSWLLILGLLLCAAHGAADARHVSGLRQFTVSGHSSGGSMASQHAVVFSDRVLGLGHFEAAPFGCANYMKAVNASYNVACSRQDAVPAMTHYAQESARLGRIANLTHLSDMPIYVFGGGMDTIVNDTVVRRAAEFYSLLSKKVQLHIEPLAEHAFVASRNVSGVNGCSHLGVQFVNYCGYDMPRAMFRHLYGAAVQPAQEPPQEQHLFSINQSQFFPAGMSSHATGMAMRGLVYVPGACRKDPSNCSLHLVYHGCGCSIEQDWSETIVRKAGFNEIAESNGILVLYPQLHWPADWKQRATNRCWDWNGEYSSDSSEFDSRQGLQLTIVNKMVDALSSLVSAAYDQHPSAELEVKSEGAGPTLV